MTKFRVKHVVKGNNVDEAAVKRSIELSEEKYCTVLATINSTPEMESSFEVQADI